MQLLNLCRNHRQVLAMKDAAYISERMHPGSQSGAAQNQGLQGFVHQLYLLITESMFASSGQVEPERYQP
jgi:uncharacterized protein YchJ